MLAYYYMVGYMYLYLLYERISLWFLLIDTPQGDEH